MKILMISQVFWPDTASVAQHMVDLAEKLRENHHTIKVITSRNAYEDTSIKFLLKEEFKGIDIERLRHTAFGKRTVIGRLVDFFTFNCILCIKLITVKKNQYDLIFGTTIPPLVSYIGVSIAKLKNIPFCYWTMDLQPELAIASKMIKENSISAKVLSYLGHYSIKKSDLIFSLDKYMKSYLVERGADENKTFVLPIWPAMDKVYEEGRLKNPFRLKNDFMNKIVVMYSGNHAYVHPLDTLLQAAYDLKENENFLFVFIGGGVRKRDVTNFKSKNALKNIVQLPFEPRSNIYISLGAADIHAVIMGDKQVGFTHPNKIYGAMFIGKPVLYIGPTPSHISDILERLNGNVWVDHGNADELVKQLLLFENLSEAERESIGNKNRQFAQQHFHPDVLKSEMVQILENEMKLA